MTELGKIAHDKWLGGFRGTSGGSWDAVAEAVRAHTQRWRPMEEAPKDGTPVLLEDQNGRRHLGYWTQGQVPRWRDTREYQIYPAVPVRWREI